MGLLKKLLGGPDAAPRKKITLGGVALPSALEPLHSLLAGSTGTGKTTLVDEVLAVAVPRGDRVIVCDPNGHHLSRFWCAGDTVLNPFDARAPGWCVFNEVRRDFDYDRLARSVVPDGRGADAQWHHYAQVLLAETLRALMLKGEGTTQRLMHWLAVAKSEELAGLLAGTPAQGLFDKDAAKALGSTRFILTAHLNAHKYLRPGDFSVRTWLTEGRGNLFLTWREDMQSALMPLIACWTDIVLNAVLSLPGSGQQRIWLILDELGALGRLNSLEAALTRGRKHGLAVVAGLQSTAQLDRIYGRESAIVLRSCFRNLVVFAVAKSDPDTAEMLSRALGEREIDREQRSRSEGPQGITRGVTMQRLSERIALASEITGLPNLTAFLALAGDHPVRKIQVTPQDLPRLAAPLEDGSC